jgi:Ca2+-binding RTX toxin-like protein
MLGVLLAATAIPGGIAAAKKIHGDGGNDHLVGTAKRDKIGGRGGDDTIEARGGNDRVKGGSGFDTLAGKEGNDLIRARDGEPDEIDCGDGVDTAVVDLVEDGVLDCEQVVEP